MISDVRVEIKVPGELRLLAVSDTHMPFVAHKKLAEVYHIARALKPTHIWQCGDLYDMYSFSRFARSLNLMTPADELKEGKKQAVEMWRKLQEAAPKAVCLQSRGNHSYRVVKQLMTRAPEFESLLNAPISALTEFKGVQDMKSHRSEIALGDILLIHGWKTKLGDHAAYFGQSVVRGHSHHGGVAFLARKGVSHFELDCGHLADIEALPLQYGESKTNSWVAGCGVVDRYGPRFIAL